MIRRNQLVEDVVIPFLLLNRDGSPATGEAGNITVTVYNPLTQQNVPYEMPTITERAAGYYEARFSKDATIKTFTDDKGEIPYEVIFNSNTPGVDPVMVIVRTFNEYPWIKILESSATATGTGIYSVALNFQDSTTSHPIPDVRFSILNSSDQLLHTGISDNNGVAAINLDPDTYTIRPYKVGYNFTEQQIQVVDDSTVSFTITGSPITYTPAPDPQLCRIHIFVADFGLNPGAGIKIYIDPKKVQIAGDKVIVEKNQYYVVTDENGYAWFDAFRGGRIIVSIPDASLTQEILIPDKASESLVNLLNI